MSLHELDMAKRVSDHIMCIDGRYVDRYGTPEEVFTDQYVSGLFGITAGSFDETGEDLELEKPDGRARIFVIAGGGLGRKSFRSLQRKGIPFATGIIYENDLDYPAAKALSAEIVSARSFEPVDDALIEKAKELIDACEGVICDRTEFGTYEQFNSRLYEYAVSTGKIGTALVKLLFTLQFNIHDKATDYHINSDSRYRYGKGNYGTGYNVQFRQELSCRGLVPYFQTGRIQGGTV